MPGKTKRLYGPAALTATYTDDIYRGGGGSALVRDIVTHIHIANNDAVARTFRIFLGATGTNGAGTEIFYDKEIAANDVYDWYGRLVLVSTDYLVGAASAATALAILIEGEQEVA